MGSNPAAFMFLHTLPIPKQILYKSPCYEYFVCMQSTARSVPEYIQSLPADQAPVVGQLRAIILSSLPQGYVETMAWGMICYEVPLSVLPDTYNKKPLVYLGLAAQKRLFSLYLLNIYQDPVALEQLKDAYRSAGKQLDMGKSCIRFNTRNATTGRHSQP